jgi:hypothetical protein
MRDAESRNIKTRHNDIAERNSSIINVSGRDIGLFYIIITAGTCINYPGNKKTAYKALYTPLLL